MKTVLIANRGEIAIRIAQALAEMNLESVTVFSEDEASALHVNCSDRTVPLKGQGARAYLDIPGLIAAANESHADAVHPGYGFLSESAEFARAVGDAGMTFIGPSPEALERLGDKASARRLAQEIGAPVNLGLDGASSEAEVAAFMATLDGAPIVLKALSGGGGRGMRIVRNSTELSAAYAAASEEAIAAFGQGALYAERFLDSARHIEVQVLGDGASAVHIWDRDCTLQRRYQKLIEIAPAPNLDDTIRKDLQDSAVRMAEAVGYRGLCTFEYLVGHDGAVAFIEANPRIQVEHTVTEAITGIDLVQAQIRVCDGASLADLNLTQAKIPQPRGNAVQLRVNLEKMGEDGSAIPTGGVLSAYEPPSGPGIRVDGSGYAGLRTSSNFDSLLAKVIVHSPGSLEDTLTRARRALRSFRIEGIETNISFLHALIDIPEIIDGRTDTRMIEARAAQLFRAASKAPAPLTYPLANDSRDRRKSRPDKNSDPLGVLSFGRQPTETQQKNNASSDPGTVTAPMQGSIISLEVEKDSLVAKGSTILVMEAMKMQHAITSTESGRLKRFEVEVGDTVYSGDPMFVVEPDAEAIDAVEEMVEVDLDQVRPDLQEVLDRRACKDDASRVEATAKRHSKGKQTPRENIAQLVDEGTFVEHGDLVIAAQRSRRTLSDLIQNTPADGLITGFGRVNGKQFGSENSRIGILHYDYTVLAGTQGKKNHEKTDRMLKIIGQQKVPMVFFCEGGGGRPGDVDVQSVSGLQVMTFHMHARLSGLVPMVGIGSGRCFAGNAALLGCCDVVIATRDASIGMGGPAMIEGGGLGVYRPEEVGPSDIQSANGVIDILVEDEAEAVQIARKYLSYFQGRTLDWETPDSRVLRTVVPANRLAVYDVHAAIDGIADLGSVLELRAGFAPGMVTSMIRVEGRPMGVVANNPLHLAGAIDAPGADKAARFLQLCDAHDLPVMFLCDTPGMMVGPEIEKTALVRHCSRLFVIGSNISVPTFTFVLRKAYGLGAQGMAGGSFRAPLFVASWPTGEFGGMGLEGAVKLGFRKELEAVEDITERKNLFDKMVAESYERGKAINVASMFEIDAVIDPAETRTWIVSALEAAPAPERRSGKKLPWIDTW